MNGDHLFGAFLGAFVTVIFLIIVTSSYDQGHRNGLQEGRAECLAKVAP